MDPSSIVTYLVREIALDGTHGVDEQRLWSLYARKFGSEPDDSLKRAIQSWIAKHPAIQLESHLLKASEDLQWATLTGLPRAANPVGNLAFELLCLIARSREHGVSTVEASKLTGQDLRSLFGRVQLLVNLGLVQRFPVIEHGSSTNRMVFHLYTDSHNLGDAAVDKQAILARITEFCKSGMQGMRTVRTIVRDLGNELEIKRSRKRPTIMNSLRELESLGCVRRVTMVHPDLPDRQYSCIEYVRDYEVQPATAIGSGIASLVVAPPSEEDIDEDEAVDDEDDEDDGLGGAALSGAALRSTAEHGAGVAGDSLPGVLANTAYPLVNQIYDLVDSTRAQGISAMELTRRLTGLKYRKALSKYLEGLTTAPPKGSELAQLEHMGLVKGVDFNKKVKFYRYFSKIAYSDMGELPEHWGEFAPVESAAPTSLARLSSALANPLPGVCTVVKTAAGELKPVFHGEKEVSGEVVLRSSPADSKQPLGTAQPARRKRGRPRKNAPKEPPKEEILEDSPAPEVPLVPRVWEGGRQSTVNDLRRARWLDRSSRQTVLLKLEAPDAAHHVHEPAPQPAPQPLSRPAPRPVPESTEKGGAVSNTNSGTQLPAPPASSPTVGSLAMRSRIQTLTQIVRENNGVLQGGAPLLEKFNQAVSGESTVDRRTVNGVVDKLVRDGTLQKLYVNVPTTSGKAVIKFILYDPALITDLANDPHIKTAKYELVSGYKEKHAQATKAALDAARVAMQNLPKRKMTDEQMEALRPKSLQGTPRRIMSTRSRAERSPRVSQARTRFGPSAAEVLGVDPDGTMQSRVKRPSRRGVSSAGVPQVKSEVGPINAGLPETARPSENLQTVTPQPQGTSPADLEEPDLEFLARAVIIYRSLFSPNNSSNVDWKIVAAVTPGVTGVAEARRLWPDARAELASHETNTRITDVVLMKTKQFEHIFLEAYRRGLIAYEDNQDPYSAIPLYAEWWRTSEQNHLIDELSGGQDPSRGTGGANAHIIKHLEELRLKDRPISFSEIDPCGSLQSQVSIVNAEKLLFNATFGVPINRALTSLPQLTDNEMRLRAVIAADAGPSYSAEQAARELHGLSNSDTETARSGLESKRVIQWAESDPEKVPTGRPYVLSELVENTLAVPKLEGNIAQKLAENFAFFNISDGTLDVPATVDESDMMCLIELATFGIYEKNVKLKRVGEKFGLISADYKSRGIDKHEFECNIVCDVSGPATEDVEEFSRYIEPPRSENVSRPWIWQTQFLSSRSIWFKVTFKILMMILFRPGITLDIVALNLRTALDYEETSAAIHALTHGGAIRAFPESKGLFVVPNWFEYIVAGI